MKTTLKRLRDADLPAMWQINEEGLPGVGKVNEGALSALLDFSTLPVGAYHGTTLVGFVLCLPPRTPYGSLNYAWFNARYEHFLYVDRIAVGLAYRDLGVGAALYGHIFDTATAKGWPVAAEGPAWLCCAD